MIDKAVASGILPDKIIRGGIQHLSRIKEDIGLTASQREVKRLSFIENMRRSPVAVETDLANDQYHYFHRFFELVLGKNLKYSCCHWDKSNSLDEAENEMLDLTISRAQITDGMKILELGCGWGSITLSMAKKYPNSEILAVSNSPMQREFILNKAKQLGLSNVSVETHNVAS